MTEYDEMANKHVITDKELAKVKRSSKSKINTDKEVIDSLKKERDSFRKKMEAKKEKNRLAKIDIKEERKIQSQYMA
jgi:predicted phage tail protein